MRDEVVTQRRLLELFHYNPDTGVFTWRCGRRAGKRAGSNDGKGYRRTSADGREYRVSRLAWLYVHGRWPDEQMDHINGNKADDRMSNLRPATVHQQAANRHGANKDNVTGIRGVYLTRYGKYQVRAKKDGKNFAGGSFATLEDAERASRELRVRLFGTYAGTVR